MGGRGKSPARTTGPRCWGGYQFDDDDALHEKNAHAVPLASARQHPENQKENQAGHSPERAVEGQPPPGGRACLAALTHPGPSAPGCEPRVSQPLALHHALRRMAGLVFLLVFWVLAGA